MYLVGVIPGPHKPSKDQINHFLRPLVSQLLVFWNTGVYFSRTAKYALGRLARCMLVPLVCDLPAARQTAGFGQYNAKYFCSVCRLPLHDINNLDPSTWPPHSGEQHRVYAEHWRSRTTAAQRKAAFEEHSVRWSALLDLPYWDPVRYTVIDSMHNHYLGLLKHHCRTLWGMNVAADDADDDSMSSIPEPSPEDLGTAFDHLYTGTSENLLSCNRSMMQHIHEELPRTELPAWVDRVPANVGTKERGKLSADQWHVFCVVNLPIILIRKWGLSGGRQREMLDNFMDLVTEVVVGNLLEMSEEAIRIYEVAALSYLCKAKELYDFKVTPNLHNSIHIPFFLRFFGPLHPIRTFFSERMNYLLQQTNTNMHFG
ncbi:hypothetical protein FKP32DRAFT_1579810, partial [Trametes sanguinea]